MNHPFPFLPPFDHGNHEVDSSRRQFLNGRIFYATIQDVREFEDETGTMRQRLISLSSADCGCNTSLQELAMCEICIQRIVCPMHRIDSCHICTRCACNLCCVTALREEEVEAGNPQPMFVCKPCYEALVEVSTPKLIAFFRKFLDWMKP